MSEIPNKVMERLSDSGDFLFQGVWLAVSISPFALGVIMQIAEIPIEPSSMNSTLIPFSYTVAGMMYRLTKEMNKKHVKSKYGKYSEIIFIGIIILS